MGVSPMSDGVRVTAARSFLFILSLFLAVEPGFAAGETAPYPRRDAVVRAVQQASAAVVNISAKKIHEQQSPFSRGAGDPFFDQFFRDFFDAFGPRQYTTQSLGSGVIISPEGYILTNDHVVSKAAEITVRLADQGEYPATLVGSDPKSDLAVLLIKADPPTPFIGMGRADDLMIGETVIAIGNPFGLSHTVTTGVVSAVNRSIRTGNRTYQDFIQTDASINPGNSGGPLLNINGELIGINTAIYQKAEGIGFAIPIDRARRIYEDLVAYGRVNKPWVGIFLQDVTPSLARHFGVSPEEGVLISKVVEGAPGDRAGLREGDLVMSIGNRKVKNRESYLSLIEGYRPGEKIRFAVLRKGTPREMDLKSQALTPEITMDISREWLGLDIAQSRDRSSDRVVPAAGVLVSSVDERAEAYRIGIRRGDIIRQVNNIQIERLEDYQRAMEQVLNTESLVLLVMRENRGYYVTLVP
ncbi:MAG: Do family serine endopeptidase [bacterium]|nr:Do family serine endopeptidase [bacterium]